MLQANEIQQRFTQIQQTIRDAEQVCQSQQDAPNEIRDVIQKPFTLATICGAVRDALAVPQMH